MKTKWYVLGLFIAAGVVTTSLALAQVANESSAADKPKLPAGWTEEDMQAAIAAGTPGKMHQLLAKDIGQWQGKSTMWMTPGADPIVSESKSTVTSLMDGRYTKAEMDGEMPGMGPYKGFGIYGYDNVSKQFVCTWIDNHSTGMMTGTGELSEDGKTITWDFTFNCPIAKGPMKMREVETATGPDSKRLEMFGPDPKTGKEYQMMRIDLKKVPGSAEVSGN